MRRLRVSGLSTLSNRRANSCPFKENKKMKPTFDWWSIGKITNDRDELPNNKSFLTNLKFMIILIPGLIDFQNVLINWLFLFYVRIFLFLFLRV